MTRLMFERGWSGGQWPGAAQVNAWILYGHQPGSSKELHELLGADIPFQERVDARAELARIDGAQELFEAGNTNM